MTAVNQELLAILPLKSSEGIALALADEDDGAVMIFKWCNRAFSEITGYAPEEAIGRRGTILIGRDMEQGMHLLIIDKLMKWERFSVRTITNRKNGQPFWVKMSWNPISEPGTSQRWWICTLTELDQPFTGPWRLETREGKIADPEITSKLSDEIVRLEKENRRLLDLANTVARQSKEDILTGLYNRRHFEIQLKAWISGLRKGGSSFAVLCADIDRFKSVNDTFGHWMGDQLLIHMANVIRKATDKDDLIARIGGDEFVILKPLSDTALTISGLADTIVSEMQKPFVFEGQTILCGASAGVALADQKTEAPERVVSDADEALYHAKSNGRGRWSFFTTEMHAESVATKKLATELLVACDRQQFLPFFQPIVDASSGQIASAEVLVRWMHPLRGLLGPDEFLRVADAMGILNRLDQIIFQALRRELSFFDALGVDLPRLSINVSAGRLQDPSFIHDIKSSGIEPKRFVAEILESVYLDRISEPVKWALEELVDLGVTIAVDDFGTGHASVQGLLKISPHVLKIDREFVRPAPESAASRDLLSAIIGIGKSLGTKIVAEGVETALHAQLARELGCDYLQGFHIGHPMSGNDLIERLKETGGQLIRFGP